MNLHIFNPEHDLALAFGGEYFTAPHAGRQLRSDLGFIPALWAEDGDIVLVDDVPNALAQVRHLKCGTADVLYMTKEELGDCSFKDVNCMPWGWDAALRHQLSKIQILSETNGCSTLPTDSRLTAIRNISNRRWAAEHLGNRGVYCTTIQELEELAMKWGQYVLKAPWSSSGRGVRYFDSCHPGTFSIQLAAWAESVIRKQGGIMIEPFLNKVRDFGMEFEAHEDGTVTYEGLSLFETVNGAYSGNLLASESEKEKILTRYVSEAQLHATRDFVIKGMSGVLRNIYEGPLGVDMMIVAGNQGFDIVKCVELNLRRTMGHVALAVTKLVNPDGTAPSQLMRIEYDGSHYHFRIIDTQLNALNTSVIK